MPNFPSFSANIHIYFDKPKSHLSYPMGVALLYLYILYLFHYLSRLSLRWVLPNCGVHIISLGMDSLFYLPTFFAFSFLLLFPSCNQSPTSHNQISLFVSYRLPLPNPTAWRPSYLSVSFSYSFATFSIADSAIIIAFLIQFHLPNTQQHPSPSITQNTADFPAPIIYLCRIALPSPSNHHQSLHISFPSSSFSALFSFNYFINYLT